MSTNDRPIAPQTQTPQSLAIASEAQASPRPAPPTPSAFWVLFWFALAAIAAKMVLLGPPVKKAWLAWAGELATIAQADVLFAVIAGLLAQGTLLASRRWPRLQSTLWCAWLGLGALGVAFTVASVWIFDFFRAPLTFGLIDVAGGLAALPRRVAHFVSIRLALAMAGAALLYLLLAWLCERRLQPRRTWRFRLGQGACLLSLLPYTLLAQQHIAGPWRPRHDARRMAQSPHYALAASLAAAALQRSAANCGGRFEAEDPADFRIARHRPDRGQPTPALPRGPRNVIFIVLESVATRYMGVYGSKYPTTPCLQAEQNSALVFENIYAPVTNSGNSLLAMALSQYAPMSWREYIVQRPRLSGVALSDVLHAKGYRTAVISSCDLSYASILEFLADRGFDTLWHYADLPGKRTGDWGVDDASMIDSTLKWIDQDPTRPFFIFCWNQGTHWPFDPAPGQEEIDFLQNTKADFDYELWRSGADKGVSALGAYLNAIHYNDKQLGRLFAALRQRKLDQDTLVVITGDHGEAFGGPHQSWGHTGKIYQEDVQVPLILWAPGLFKSAQRSQTIGGLIDTGPTILDLLNQPAPPTWQGQSLFSPAHPGRAYFYGCRDDYLLGLRQGNLKYIFNTSADRDELYDLSIDPEEQTNLAPAHPDRCRRYRQRLAAWVDYQIRMYP